MQSPYSVIQGSTLSCLLYLVYTLDIPTLYHTNNPTIEHQLECTEPTPNTFVDDTTIKIDISNPATRQQKLEDALDKIKNYMDSNKLALNPDKTKLFIVSKNPDVRKQLFLDVQPERIKHSPTFQYLGISISQDLKWNEFLLNNKNSLSKQLSKRITAIKKLKKYIKFPLLKIIATGIFMSKMHYGMELWSAAPQYLKKKMQSIQLAAARAVIGYKSYYWSKDKLLKTMDWLSIDKLLTHATVKLAHQMLHISIPEILAFKIQSKMSKSNIVTTITGKDKYGPKPKEFGKTTITKYQFKANIFEQYPKINEKIIQIKNKKRFGYWSKKYLLDNKKIPTKIN